jgi:hypothetical protein
MRELEGHDNRNDAERKDEENCKDDKGNHLGELNR